MERPTCKTCPFYDAEAKMEMAYFDSFEGPASMRTSVLEGICKLNPVAQHKTPDDWCGKHPSFPAYIASLKPTESIMSETQSEASGSASMRKLAIALYELNKGLGI